MSTDCDSYQGRSNCKESLQSGKMFYFQWNENANNSTSIEFGAPVTQWLEFGVVTGQSQGCVICQGFV